MMGRAPSLPPPILASSGNVNMEIPPDGFPFTIGHLGIKYKTRWGWGEALEMFMLRRGTPRMCGIIRFVADIVVVSIAILIPFSLGSWAFLIAWIAWKKGVYTWHGIDYGRDKHPWSFYYFIGTFIFAGTLSYGLAITLLKVALNS